LFKFLSANKNLFALKPRFILPAALALCSGFAQADIYRSLDPATPTRYTNTLPAEGRWELYLKEKAAPIRDEPVYDQRRFTVNSHSRYASQIQAAAMANNVEAALIRAVISVESGYNSAVVSSAGAVGLMQLMPETARRYNVADRYDPEQNIHGGTEYLHDLLRMFNYDLRLTIAAYNAGEQAVMKYGNRIPPYRETLAYVPKVMKLYKQYSAGSASAKQSGYKRLSTTWRKKGTRTRVSRTYMVNPA
jgi:soluble lytic murein transglycosylase-like protein